MEGSGAERQGKMSRAGDGGRIRDIGDGKMLQKKSGKNEWRKRSEDREKKRTNKRDGK